VPSPKGNGSIKGYLVRSIGADTRSETVTELPSISLVPGGGSHGKTVAPYGKIGKDLVQAVLTGGYPEMLRREDRKRRQIWARDYIRAIVQRDVREVTDLEKLDQMNVGEKSAASATEHALHAESQLS
jgi:predicted AAA+ superfamily ATPase